MAKNNRATEKFDKKRDAIIRAASVLINEQGVQATTLASVAKAIGLNATSITYYFSRKEKLVIAVYDATLDLMETMARDAWGQSSPAARLRHYIADHVALRKRIRRGETGLLTALSEIRTLDEDSQVDLLNRYRSIVNIVREFFGKPTDAKQKALYTVRAHVLLEAVMWWPAWSRRYSVLDFDRVEERLFDVLAYGVSAAHSQWNPQKLSGDWRTDSGDAPSQNAEFLRAATVTINERGYRSASVNRIAETLNVTKGSFYHHHDTKDDLVLACFQQGYDRLSATQMAGLNIDGDYWTRLSSVMAELIDLQFCDMTPLLRTTALQALESNYRFDVVMRYNHLARRFAGMLIDGIADGSVRPIDPLVASQVLMSTLNGAYEGRRWAQRFTDPDEAIRVYASTLHKGMIDT
jgi:AcrR family transcriptional regulator